MTTDSGQVRPSFSMEVRGLRGPRPDTKAKMQQAQVAAVSWAMM
jgi:hypothetical protein